MHGACARCGKVPPSHFAAPPSARIRDASDWERERLKSVHAFFSKKRKNAAPKAQLKLWREDA